MSRINNCTEQYGDFFIIFIIAKYMESIEYSLNNSDGL